MEFPIIVGQCPSCGGTETVSRAAQKAVFPHATDTPTALERVITPIANQAGDPGIVPRVVVVSHDVCAACGTRYCVRAELVALQQRPRIASGF